MIVVDAGVLATALADDGDDGDRARARLRGHTLAAPEGIDLDVLSVLSRLLRNGELPVRRAEQALVDLIDLPVRRARHQALIHRCWSLRDYVTPSAAAYVALAEELAALLITTDARLARAPGVACDVEVLHRGPAPEAEPQ